MIDNINLLEYIFNLVKGVKKPIVKLYPDGRIIGTDLNFASMNMIIGSDISYNIDIPYIFISTELSAFIRYIQTKGIDPKKIIYSKFDIKCDDIVLINHLEMNIHFDDLYDRVTSYINNKLLFKEENFNKVIPEMFSLKTSDGSKMFKCGINREYIMSSFNSIHPATKSDKVDLIIYDIDRYSYIAEFIIYKKKENYQLHEFLRFIKL